MSIPPAYGAATAALRDAALFIKSDSADMGTLTASWTGWRIALWWPCARPYPLPRRRCIFLARHVNGIHIVLRRERLEARGCPCSHMKAGCLTGMRWRWWEVGERHGAQCVHAAPCRPSRVGTVQISFLSSPAGGKWRHRRNRSQSLGGESFRRSRLAEHRPPRSWCMWPQLPSIWIRRTQLARSPPFSFIHHRSAPPSPPPFTHST